MRMPVKQSAAGLCRLLRRTSMTSASRFGDAQLRIATLHEKEPIVVNVNRAYAVEDFFVPG